MPTTDINDAAKPLSDAWPSIKNDYMNAVPGKYLEITTVYRSPAEQFTLFKKGRSEHMGPNGSEWFISDKEQVVTNVDGRKNMGAHNFYRARAIDVMVKDNQTGKETWKEEFYLPLGPIAAKYGLIWGGNWKSIKDMPHLEVKDFKNYKEA